MADVLPPQSARWTNLVATFATHATRAGFGMVVTPMIEQVEVFHRVGESTDIVRKEMYDFEDKGGRRVAVRPEFTASIMRAFAEHRPTTPWKVWMVGPNFRYEQPQSGRLRQHFQVEAIAPALASIASSMADLKGLLAAPWQESKRAPARAREAELLGKLDAAAAVVRKPEEAP